MYKEFKVNNISLKSHMIKIIGGNNFLSVVLMTILTIEIKLYITIFKHQKPFGQF